jgi:predicted transcriptional regulator
MTREIETCTEDESVAGIMERMTTGKFRHMPVVRSGTLVGLISIGDVVKQRVGQIEQESEAMRDYIRSA